MGYRETERDREGNEPDEQRQEGWGPAHMEPDVLQVPAWGLYAMALQQVHHTRKRKPRIVGSIGVRYCQSWMEKWKHFMKCHK